MIAQRQIAAERAKRGLAEVAVAFFFSLAAHLEDAAFHVHVPEAEADGLADAQAGAVNDFQHGGVAGGGELRIFLPRGRGVGRSGFGPVGGGRGKEASDLLLGQDLRQVFRGFQRPEVRGGIAVQHPLADEEAAETAQAGEFTQHGAAGESFGLQGDQEFTGRLAVERRPGQGAVCGGLPAGEPDELEQIPGIGVKRVARGIALRFQMAQEAQNQWIAQWLGGRGHGLGQGWFAHGKRLLRQTTNWTLVG